MPEYNTTTVSLPRDPGGRRFMGISGKMFRAFDTTKVVNTTEELAAAVGLVKVDGTTPLFGASTSAASIPVVIATDDGRIGAVNETAPGTDTAASGLNGRLQRIAQHASGVVPVIGATNETAPATDTATSALNGRLQRIAQRLTSLIALLPTALSGNGNLKVSLADVAGSFNGMQGTGTVDTATQRITIATDDALKSAVTDSDEGAESGTDEAAFAAATGLRYFGFSARETTETGRAVFNIRRGIDNTGAIMDTISLGPGESRSEWYGPCGIESAAGIWLERVSGTCQVIPRGKVM